MQTLLSQPHILLIQLFIWDLDKLIKLTVIWFCVTMQLVHLHLLKIKPLLVFVQLQLRVLRLVHQAQHLVVRLVVHRVVQVQVHLQVQLVHHRQLPARLLAQVPARLLAQVLAQPQHHLVHQVRLLVVQLVHQVQLHHQRLVRQVQLHQGHQRLLGLPNTRPTCRTRPCPRVAPHRDQHLGTGSRRCRDPLGVRELRCDPPSRRRPRGGPPRRDRPHRRLLPFGDRRQGRGIILEGL